MKKVVNVIIALLLYIPMLVVYLICHLIGAFVDVTILLTELIKGEYDA